MKRWTLNYKRQPGWQLSGVIEASSTETAEAVGRAWCAKQNKDNIEKGWSFKFLSVTPELLADETILNSSPAEPEKPASTVPLREQEQRVRERGGFIDRTFRSATATT